MNKPCRSCGAELIPGDNWRLSCVQFKKYVCKACIRAYNRAYYEANRDRLSKYRSEWGHKRRDERRDDPEKRQAYNDYQRPKNAAWRKENMDKLYAAVKRWNQANPEKRRAYNRKWAEKNRLAKLKPDVPPDPPSPE